jgi:hypothetical protein
MSNATLQPGWDLERTTWMALRVGLVCLAICALGGFFSPAAFFRSYLVAYLFFLGISLGCLPILMLYHQTGGAWGVMIRRFLECGTRMLPLMLVLFLPIAFGLHYLYSWTNPDFVRGDAVLEHKQVYLNVPFFIARTIIYFVLWITVAAFLNLWSWQQDQGRLSASMPRRFRLISGPGLLIYGLTITFAATDWLMSLEPHWYSTIFAALYATGQCLTALSFGIVLLTLLADRPPFREFLSPDTLNDLGNLLLAFVMLWTYMAFSQYLLIWAGNLKEEITWFQARTRHGWQWIALALILLHFALPFLLLLSRDIKRNPRNLRWVAGGVLFMRLIDLYWEVLPAFAVPQWEEAAPRVYEYWMFLVAPFGLGGVWLGTYLWQLKRWPLAPLQDANLHHAAELHEHDVHIQETTPHG